MKQITKTNQLPRILLFTLIGLILSQITFTKVIGSSLSFSLFDFFAPTVGAFLGGPIGILTVLIVNLTNFFIKGISLEPAALVRLVTNLFGVWYFSLSLSKKQNKFILIVPILAMIAFWLNPVGRQVWYFALYWTIPLLAYFKRNHLFIKSLGATFISHSVGGAVWIWTLSFPATGWRALVPVIAFERLSFAVGITVSYLIFSYIFKYLESKKLFPLDLKLHSI